MTFNLSLRRLCLVFLMIAAVRSNAQQKNYLFTQIGTDEGLSTGTVNCVYKDSRGFVWIGTVDGLNRYDGYEIKVYKNDISDSLSLADNIVNCIAEDNQGRVWIGTRGNGISIYDPEKGYFTKPGNGDPLLNGIYIRDILVDEDVVIIATTGIGLVTYDIQNKLFRNYSYSTDEYSGISSNDVFSILKDAPGKYWLGTRSDGIDYFDLSEESFDHISIEKDYLSRQTNRKPLLKDKQNKLWIGTDGNGLYQYDLLSAELTFFDHGKGKGLQSGIITTLFEGSDGQLWIGTDGKGIHILDQGRKEFTYLMSDLIDDNSLSSDAVYEIYADNSGALWVSTFRGGVNYYSTNRTKFDLLEQIPFNDNSLSFNSVIGLAEGPEGTVWIGTDGGGLDRYDPSTGNFEHYRYSANDKNTLNSNVIKSVCYDSRGNIWAGTYAAGLNKLNLKTGKVTRYAPNANQAGALPDRNIWAIFEDTNQTLWLGMLGGGLARYNPDQDTFDKFQTDGTSTGISSNLVVVLFEDSEGNFWVGTEDGGLNLFNREAETFMSIQQDINDSTGLLNDNIRAICQDQQGILWIGTADGVNLLNPESMEISVASVTELLPSRVINGILEDQSGKMWISTNKGLSSYNPNTGEAQHFTQSDGLQGNEFNYTSNLKTSSGVMYFGGMRGLNKFDPQEIKLSTFNPQVILTDIKVFDQSIVGHRDSPHARNIPTLSGLESVTFTHRENVFAFEFAALDYTSPGQNVYQYKLEGFDEKWVVVGASKRSASYTNLDPGTYTFRVRGTNSDGVWSTNERNLEVIVLAPWWATYWFRAIVLIALISAGIWIYRWRITQIRNYQKKLEQRVEEATSQVLSQNEVLKHQQDSLQKAIEDTNMIVNQAVNSGDFKARIELEGKDGEWRALGSSINQLFESILEPFETINHVVNTLANSDLSQRFENDARGDILRLKNNLNHALDNLSGLLHEIIAQVEYIGKSTQEMAATSEEMNVSTGEIASSIGEMSRGAHDQVSRIDESSQLIEGILRFSNEMGDQAKGINAAAEQGVEKSDVGKSLIENLESRMKNIIQFSKETSESMKLLTDRSAEIARVLNLIKEVANETNLLALNAAIEAAKAGDSGKGFAVVAEQIRILAENSAGSTKEIEAMVGEIQESVGTTAKLVKEMGSMISGGEEASKNASASFDELAASYSQTLTLSQGIVQATGRQTEDLSKVVGLMESVVVIAEQTASGTEEIASSSTELSAGMTEFNNSTQRVMEIVETLKDKVMTFKLKEKA